MSKITRSVRRPLILLQASLAVLALLITCSPTFAGSASVGSAGPIAGDSQNPSQPNVTCPNGQCFTDVPPSNNFFAYINRIYQDGIVSGYTCGGSNEPCDSYHRPYYRPTANVTRQGMAKFIDNARHLPQIYIEGAKSNELIYAHNTSTNSGDKIAAIWGWDDPGIGVSGVSDSGWGVSGESGNGVGVRGLSLSGDGVQGQSDSGYAGHFYGNVYVTGHITAPGGCCSAPELVTRIDDPLDPAGKYLNEAAVQSPDLTTVINGNVTLDGMGEATVSVPAWFTAANGNFRYSLTAVGAPGPNLYIVQELSGTQFRIAGGAPNGRVSWQVTGIRQDAYAGAHPPKAEEDKPATEKGKYQNPAEYGQPSSLGVDYDQQQKLEQSVQDKP